MAFLDTINEINKYNVGLRYCLQATGLLGNLFMYAVYSRGHLSKLSVSIYIRCMALVCACQNVYNFLVLKDWYLFVNKSEFLCKTVYFLLKMLPPLAAWFEVVASLDRFLTVVFSIRSKLIHRAIFKRAVVAWVLVYNMAFYSRELIFNKLVRYNNGRNVYYTECESSLSAIIVGLADFANNSAVPFVVMLFTSVAMFAGVMRARRRVKRVETDQEAVRKRTRDIRFGVTILAMNFAFFAFNFPYSLNQLIDWHSMLMSESSFAFWISSFLLTDMYELYYSMHFFVQLAVNNLVRKESCKILTQLLNKILLK